MGAYSLADAQRQLRRLVEEALSGEIVTITRDGRPVVTLTPATSEKTPPNDEFLDRMRQRALARPSLGGDSVTLVRQMRDEDR